MTQLLGTLNSTGGNGRRPLNSVEGLRGVETMRMRVWRRDPAKAEQRMRQKTEAAEALAQYWARVNASKAPAKLTASTQGECSTIDAALNAAVSREAHALQMVSLQRAHIERLSELAVRHPSEVAGRWRMLRVFERAAQDACDAVTSIREGKELHETAIVVPPGEVVQTPEASELECEHAGRHGSSGQPWDAIDAYTQLQMANTELQSQVGALTSEVASLEAELLRQALTSSACRQSDNTADGNPLTACMTSSCDTLTASSASTYASAAPQRHVVDELTGDVGKRRRRRNRGERKTPERVAAADEERFLARMESRENADALTRCTRHSGSDEAGADERPHRTVAVMPPCASSTATLPSTTSKAARAKLHAAQPAKLAPGEADAINARIRSKARAEPGARGTPNASLYQSL